MSGGQDINHASLACELNKLQQRVAARERDIVDNLNMTFTIEELYSPDEAAKSFLRALIIANHSGVSLAEVVMQCAG